MVYCDTSNLNPKTAAPVIWIWHFDILLLRSVSFKSCSLIIITMIPLIYIFIYPGWVSHIFTPIFITECWKRFVINQDCFPHLFTIFFFRHRKVFMINIITTASKKKANCLMYQQDVLVLLKPWVSAARWSRNDQKEMRCKERKALVEKASRHL